MGGKGSGGYRKNALPREKNPIVQAANPANVDADVNSRLMEFGQEMFALEPVDWSDVESVQERWFTYLDMCKRYGFRPMVASMAGAFGINRQQLWGIATNQEAQRRYKGITPESRDYVQKCYEFLQISLETNLVEEKNSPVKWFFLAKNYFGYEDQTVRVHRTEVDIEDTRALEDVAKKYAAMAGRPVDQATLPEAEVIEVEDAN